MANLPSASVSDALLRDFIHLSGAALEEEDRVLIGRTYIRGKPAGILRLNNEHYYQFLCWKAATARWESECELMRQDIVLKNDNGKDVLAIFELKRWMSAYGTKELAGIKADIIKLKALKGIAGYLVVFSAHPIEVTNSSPADLAQMIFVDPAPSHEVYGFDTINLDGRKSTFWIAGWPVSPDTGLAA